MTLPEAAQENVGSGLEGISFAFGVLRGSPPFSESEEASFLILFFESSDEQNSSKPRLTIPAHSPSLALRPHRWEDRGCLNAYTSRASVHT